MSQDKSPVYHRTSDGRKVVIVGKSQDDLCVCFYDTALGYLYVKPEQLTPWVEPETRTVYVHWFKSDNSYGACDALIPKKGIFKAIKKITITEGEFDE